MNDLIGIGLIALLVLGAVFGLLQLSKPYDAGMSGLQKILDPAAGKAMEVQEDFKQGYYNGEQESGDGPEAGGENSKEI